MRRRVVYLYFKIFKSVFQVPRQCHSTELLSHMPPKVWENISRYSANELDFRVYIIKSGANHLNTQYIINVPIQYFHFALSKAVMIFNFPARAFPQLRMKTYPPSYYYLSKEYKSTLNEILSEAIVFFQRHYFYCD